MENRREQREGWRAGGERETENSLRTGYSFL